MSNQTGNTRTVLIIVGSPRSGTSAVCHVLNKLGLDFGDPDHFVDPETNKHNPVFFELADLNRLNDEVLETLGWTYSDFNALPLESDFDSSLADRFESKIEAFLNTHFPSGETFGLKDPRFCFTLPLWIMVLRRLGVRTRHMLTLRHPAAIAASNYRLTPERGMQHSRRVQPMSEGAARCFLEGLDFATIQFEELAANSPTARDVISRLVLASDAEVRQAIEEVVDTGLVHWQPPAPDRDSDGNSAGCGAKYRQLAELVRVFELPQLKSEGLMLGGDAHGVPTTPLGISSGWLPDRTSGGVVQIFHRTSESAYQEESSRSAPWPPHAHEAVFEIDFSAEVEANYVRVDFDDYPGAFFLRALSIDGVEILPSAALSCGSGVILVSETVGWIGLIANHSDPWLELAVDGGRVRCVRVELTRMSLAEVTRCLAQAQSVDEKLDSLQARLSKLDDRWIHNSSRLQQELNGRIESLREQVALADEAVSGILTQEFEKIEMRLALEQKERLQELSDVQSYNAQALHILQAMRAEEESRLGFRLRAWMKRDKRGSSPK